MEMVWREWVSSTWCRSINLSCMTSPSGQIDLDKCAQRHSRLWKIITTGWGAWKDFMTGYCDANMREDEREWCNKSSHGEGTATIAGYVGCDAQKSLLHALVTNMPPDCTKKRKPVTSIHCNNKGTVITTSDHSFSTKNCTILTSNEYSAACTDKAGRREHLPHCRNSGWAQLLYSPYNSKSWFLASWIRDQPEVKRIRGEMEKGKDGSGRSGLNSLHLISLLPDKQNFPRSRLRRCWISSRSIHEAMKPAIE